MTKPDWTIVIGTRGSDLAMWQARAAAHAIGRPCEIRVVKTSGDRFLDVPLQGRLEKGFFTVEIEEKLLAGEIDVAVHSLKDLPTEMHPELRIAACLKRGAVSDLLLVHPDGHEEGRPVPLKPGCRVGAASLRRQALLAVFAPDAEPAFLRGNVPSRIGRCRDGEYGAIVLARAGVERLSPEFGRLAVYELDPASWLPAPGQGAVALQVRATDDRTLDLLARIDHGPTRGAVEIERTLLANFEGGCHTAFGAWAEERDGAWRVRLGLERSAEGWVRTNIEGDAAACKAQGPDTLTDLSPPDGEEAMSLCRRIDS